MAHHLIKCVKICARVLKCQKCKNPTVILGEIVGVDFMGPIPFNKAKNTILMVVGDLFKIGQIVVSGDCCCCIR